MADNRLTVTCTSGVVSAIVFASYGTPNSNTCPNYQSGTCNAANSTSIATKLCLGQKTCVIYPNTTTFGDPCFGTPKELALVFQCSTGSGSAVCSAGPPAEPYSAVVIGDFSSKPLVTTIATPSLQARLLLIFHTVPEPPPLYTHKESKNKNIFTFLSSDYLFFFFFDYFKAVCDKNDQCRGCYSVFLTPPRRSFRTRISGKDRHITTPHSSL